MLDRQGHLTLLHYTKELPYIGFLWNKGTCMEYVAKTFATCSEAESWWQSKVGFCRVWTVRKGETHILFSK